MKFAKELDEKARPEWKQYYFDYKLGKKKITAAEKAAKALTASTSAPPGKIPSSLRDAPVFSLLALNRQNTANPLATSAVPPKNSLAHTSSENSAPTAALDGSNKTASQNIPTDQQVLLNRTGTGNGTLQSQSQSQPRRMISYGSIIGTPPEGDSPGLPQEQAPSLKLPSAALDAQPPQRSNSAPPSAQQAQEDRLNPRRSLSHDIHPDPLWSRVFGPGVGGLPTARNQRQDIPLTNYREADLKRAEFFQFLDNQLAKVDKFYRSKEKEESLRLDALRKQLHVLRDVHVEERAALAQSQRHPHDHERPSHDGAPTRENPLRKSVHIAADTYERMRHERPHKAGSAMDRLATPRLEAETDFRDYHDDPADSSQDYTRRPISKTPYAEARKRMKLVLVEYYRGVELLREFTSINHKAFRKITKKFDKSMQGTGEKGQYMRNIVNKAYFYTSTKSEELSESTVDLYARYFEKGERKSALNRLRTKVLQPGHRNTTVARSDFLLGAGLALGVQGLADGIKMLYRPEHIVTAYLLQLYAGYFFPLLLGGWFCLDAYIFSNFKINYSFILELRDHQNEDWLKLIEFPSWCFFALGLSLFLNFTIQAGGDVMFRWWVVILIGMTGFLFLVPLRWKWSKFTHNSRTWLIRSVARLGTLTIGLSSVEFRDFFLGDMFCSLTYTMGNIELFFCWYTTHWNQPEQCNSSNSYVLGVMTLLPGLVRAAQCIRRYRDSGNVYPHIANFGKYTLTILMYLTLSLYRTHKRWHFRIAFIVFATLNSLATSTWDVLNDWSLGDITSKPRLLRDILVFKKHSWVYYVAVIIDVILRFNWVPYAIWTEDVQHSSIVSFAVAFSEVCRRGLWTIFRLENEQANNIRTHKTSRDIPLPYKFAPEDKQALLLRDPSSSSTSHPVSSSSETSSVRDSAARNQFDGRSSPDLESQTSPARQTPILSSLRRNRRPTADSSAAARPATRRESSARTPDSPFGRSLQRVGTVLRDAHAQDYERRNPGEVVDLQAGSDDDDDDDDDE